MSLYSIRKATENDINSIVKIYNSNKEFILNHLGLELVDDSFIRSEMVKMEAEGFLSCIIININTSEIIGVLDYKPDANVYLSLIMLDSKFHGKGLGTLAYNSLENDMLKSKKQSIRIDVVNDYDSNVVGFWKRLGFIPQKKFGLHGEIKSQML